MKRVMFVNLDQPSFILRLQSAGWTWMQAVLSSLDIITPFAVTALDLPR